MPHDGPHPNLHPSSAPRAGHNRAPRAAASFEISRDGARTPDEKTDFDLVEASFIHAAVDHPDPTSLLRLAGVPFWAVLEDGREAHLLGYVVENVVEVGAVSPPRRPIGRLSSGPGGAGPKPPARALPLLDCQRRGGPYAGGARQIGKA